MQFLEEFSFVFFPLFWLQYWLILQIFCHELSYGPFLFHGIYNGKLADSWILQKAWSFFCLFSFYLSCFSQIKPPHICGRCLSTVLRIEKLNGCETSGAQFWTHIKITWSLKKWSLGSTSDLVHGTVVTKYHKLSGLKLPKCVHSHL